MLKHTVLVPLVLAALAGPALGYCSEPSSPYCASSFGEFTDQDDFDRCKRDMEGYQSEVEDYLSCLQGEIQDLQSELESAADQAQRDSESALSEYNDAVESFNRRAYR